VGSKLGLGSQQLYLKRKRERGKVSAKEKVGHFKKRSNGNREAEV
jgi:hypothetical protein